MLPGTLYSSPTGVAFGSFAASTTSAPTAIFDAIDTVHLATLSRIVERLRFTIGPKILDEVVTLDNMKEAFRQHELMVVRELSINIAAVGSRSHMMIDRKRSTRMAESRDLAESVDYLDGSETFLRLERIWASINEHHSELLHITYGFLFDYEFPNFPETTETQRARLVELCEQEVISRGDVAAAMQVADDDASVSFFFSFGGSLIPSEVFKDLVDSLDQHPKTLSFARHFARSALQLSKIRMLFLLQILLTIVLIFQTQSVSVREHYILQHNIRHWVANDWTTYCSNDTDVGCLPLQKTLFSVHRPEMDALRYLRTELVAALWRGAAVNHSTGTRPVVVDPMTLGTEPLGGAFPFGAMLIRMVEGHHAVPFAKNDSRCRQLNITQTIAHFELPAYYGCDSVWHIVIPFNATRQAAFDLASAVTLPPPTSKYYAIIVQFNVYSPSQGLVAHTRIVLSFPSGGGVATRLLISPIDPDQSRNVLAVVVVATLVTGMQIVLALLHYRAGSGAVVDWPALLDLVACAIVVASYALLRTIKLPADLLQVEYMSANVDTMADNFDAAMSLFGFYTLIQIGGLVRFAKGVRGLDTLFHILHEAAPKIFGLVIVYIVWTIGFVCVGMLLFGSTVHEFSSFGIAMQTLMKYFFGESEFNEIVDNNPVTGPFFYFTYKIFVSFFALHLLVAAITGPVHHLNKATTMLGEIMAAVRTRMAASSWIDGLWLTVCEVFAWPLVEFLSDASGLSHGHHMRMFRIVDSFYGKLETVDFAEAVGYADEFIEVVGQLKKAVVERTQDREIELRKQLQDLTKSAGASPEELGNAQGEADLLNALDELEKQSHELWPSHLLRSAESDPRLSDIPLAFVLVFIAAETRFGTSRDARLVQALSEFESFNNGIVMLNALQTSLVADCKSHTQSLHFEIYAAGLRDDDQDDNALGRTSSHRAASAESMTTAAILARMAAEDASERKRKLKDKRKQFALSARDSQNPLAMPSSPDALQMSGNSNPSPHLAIKERRASVALRSVRLGDAASAAADDDKMVTEEELRDTFFELYGFTQLLRVKFGNSTRFTFLSLLASVFTMWYLSIFLYAYEPTAHLTEALHRGLRRAEERMTCYDDACHDGFVFNKTFEDVDDIDEYHRWLQELLKLQLWYLTDTNKTAQFGSGALWFDPRIRLVGNVAVRQLRATPIACIPFVDGTLPVELNTEFYAQRLQQVSRFGCASSTPRSTSGFDRSTIAFSPDGPPKLFDSSAYAYSTSCAEKEPKDYAGRFGDYPCEGYTAYLNSSAALDEMIRLKFLDNLTRLIAITAVFQQSSAISTEYTMLLEISENGGGCMKHAYSFPLASTSSLANLAQERIATQIVVPLHLLMYIVLWARFLYYRRVKMLPDDLIGMMRPEVPWFLILLNMVVFVALPVAIPTATQSTRNNLAHAIIGVIYAMFLFTNFVVFPLTSLINKEVHILVTLLVNAFVQILYVIPYFFLFIGAFTLSGFVLFSRFSYDFSRVRWAFQTVSLQAFSEELIMAQWQLARPFEAQFWAMLFFAIMLVILSNLFLAMSTSATEKAEKTDPAVALAEATSHYHGTHVRYGKFFSAYIAWKNMLSNPTSASNGSDVPAQAAAIDVNAGVFLHSLDGSMSIRADKNRRRRYNSAILTHQGRLLFPSEALGCVLPPLRANGLLRMFDRVSTNDAVRSSIIAYFIANLQRYKQTNPRYALQDYRLQIEEEEMYAEGRHIGVAVTYLKDRDRRRAEKIERARPEFMAAAELGGVDLSAETPSHQTESPRRSDVGQSMSTSKDAPRSGERLPASLPTSAVPRPPPFIISTTPARNAVDDDADKLDSPIIAKCTQSESFLPEPVQDASPVARIEIDDPVYTEVITGVFERAGEDEVSPSATHCGPASPTGRPHVDDEGLWRTAKDDGQEPAPVVNVVRRAVAAESLITSWDAVAVEFAKTGSLIPTRLLEKLLAEGDPPAALVELLQLLIANREAAPTTAPAATSVPLADPERENGPSSIRAARKVTLVEDERFVSPPPEPGPGRALPRSSLRRHTTIGPAGASDHSSVASGQTRDDESVDHDAAGENDGALLKRKVDRASAARRWSTAAGAARFVAKARSPGGFIAKAPASDVS